MVYDINRYTFVDQMKLKLLTIFNYELVLCYLQAHEQIEYLKELISSLSDIPDTDSMFLIFSHDYYSEDINQLVHAIDFAPVLQIYFPFSTQLYQNEFPGFGPNDCPWNLDVAE